MNLKEYQQNRASIPLVELAKHCGQWVAFSADGRRIIASNADLTALDSLLVAMGEDPEQVGLERIEKEDVHLGGAEFAG
jgi:hypothetical protein